MTEEELINGKFQKIDISDQESDNGFDYYFYQKSLCDGLTLYSSCDIDVLNNQWFLKSYELPSIHIVNMEDYQKLKNAIEQIV
jgi:hypothetical protein